MKRYEVTIIHEPSGEYLMYSFDSDSDPAEVNIYDDFIRDISVVISDVEDLEEAE
jgi:hypothetical protein